MKISKPAGLSQKEFDDKTRWGTEAHRIYMATLDFMFEEIRMAPRDDQAVVFELTSIMIAEHLGRALGNPKYLANQAESLGRHITEGRRKK